MNILYISYDGMTDPLGQSQVLPYLTELSKAGYSFSLISCEKEDRFQKYKSKIEAICRKANIDWHPISYTKSPPLLSTLWDIQKLKKKAYFLHKEKAFNLVHCRSYIASLIGLELKRKLGTKFIFDMRGFWADERVDGGLWNLKNPFIKLVYAYFKRFEKDAILEADASICLTHKGIEEMKSWDYVTNGVRNKIHHITTCCDINHFKSAYEKRICQKFDEQNFRLVYIGSIGPWHSFDKLSKLIKTAYKNYNCKFKLLISSGSELFEKFIAENGMDRNRFEIKFVPHKEIVNELMNTDIGFFFIPIQYSKKASSPTKMGEMLAAGLPIITGTGCGDVDELINKNKIGYILKEFSEEDIKLALDHVVQMCVRDKAVLMERCLQTAQEYFSIEKGVNKYLKIYKDLVND